MAEQIFPTKGNLIACKKNLTLAKLGFDLLDRKRNVLMREMMKLIDEAAGMQRAIGDTFIKAYKALESANITLGIEHALEGAVPEEKGFSVTGHSIMGVDLPTGHLASRPLYPYYGFSGSNAQLDYAYVCFDKVKQRLPVGHGHQKDTAPRQHAGKCGHSPPGGQHQIYFRHAGRA